MDKLSPKVLWSIAAAIVIGGGVIFYAVRASDPASQGPIPYKPFDMGAHVQQMHPQPSSVPPTAAGAPAAR